MVREQTVIKFSEELLKLYEIYPELKDWDYVSKYRMKDDCFVDPEYYRNFRYNRNREIERTTSAIFSFIEMDFEATGPVGKEYLKCLIMYYLVLMDALKCKLDFVVASDEIFEQM